MKTKFFIIIALMPLCFLTAQTNVRVNTETTGYWTLQNDTMLITKADKVINGSVYCPSGSVDSVEIVGNVLTVGGINSSSIILPPGEVAIKFGFNYAFSDTVRIIARDKAWLQLQVKR